MGDSAYGGLDFPSSISPSFPLLCGLSSGQNWGAVELLVPHSISCLKPLELLMCAERACDLSSGGSDRGLLVRSTSSSERWCWSLRIGWLGAAVGCDLGAATIGFDCSEGNGTHRSEYESRILQVTLGYKKHYRASADVE
ncbi:hypothetical protein ACOSQ3_003499 [Xanthoceras sorbifolium]